jgi:hypothetical protein
MASTTPTNQSSRPIIYNRSLQLLTPVPADIDIAQAATVLPITQIADTLDLKEDELAPYGKYKAKVSISVRDRLADRPNGKYVCVAGITPTPLGEGKSTTAVSTTVFTDDLVFDASESQFSAPLYMNLWIHGLFPLGH